MNFTHRLFAFLLMPLVLVSMSCGGSSSAQPTRYHDGDRSQGHVKTRPIEWHLINSPEGATVRIGNPIDWCYGAPKPRISEVRIREGNRAVILTALLANFQKPDKQGACAGVEMGVVKTVELSEDLGDRALYDGSASPPAKRWPRP